MPNWNYIAGFFDGEGGLSPTSDHGTPRFQLYLCNSHKEVLESIRAELGEGTWGLADRSTATWNLCFNSKEAQLKLLTGVLPYVRRRKRAIVLALELLKLRPGTGNHWSDTDELLAWRIFKMLEEELDAERQAKTLE